MAARFLFVWANIALHLGLGAGNARVTDVEPRNIGYGGGTVTIHGAGFSEDVFNQFDPVLGNKVWFANEFVSVVCQSPINWNFLLENPQDPSTTKITCDLPPRAGKKGSDWFNLLLKVDGEDVEQNWSIRYTHSRTPLVRDVLPRYGRPGDAVTFKGRTFTKEYGNVNFGDQGTVDNRREESVTAILMGSRECELTDDLGNVYGMSLDSPTSNEGEITCIPGGSFIGPMNGTIFISGQYGKSQVDDNGYSVNSKNQLFMYHTLPEVTSVSPKVGASSGSTHVTITGNSFDSFPGKTEVTVGGSSCEIISINNNELVCKTPAESELTPSTAGARGLTYEIWTATEGSLEDIASYTSSAADYQSMTVDGSTVSGPYFNETNGFSAKLSGLFVAPYSGKISFYLRSSDMAALYLSTDADPSNKVELVSNSAEVTAANVGSPHSDPVELVEGNLYYMEVLHVQQSASDEKNNLQVSLWNHETVYHSSQTGLARDEQQRLDMMYTRKFETLSIQFNGVDPSAEITFTHAGINSKAPVVSRTEEEMSSVFTDMLTYSCEYQNTRHFLKQDFEDGKWLPGQGGYVQENVQAYCGAKALENQNRVFHTYGEEDSDINVGRTPWFCFAAMGTSYTGHISMKVIYEDVDENERGDWMTIENVWTPSDDWSYQCVDLYAAATNETSSPLRPSPTSKIEIQDLQLHKGTVTGKYYMDEITLSSSIVEIDRKSPALPNDNVMIKEVTVSAGEQADEYIAEIVPWSCNPVEDDLRLFGVKDAQIDGLDTSSMTPQEAFEAELQYLQTMDSVTYTSSAWGAGASITITRQVRGSRALTGTFSLSYQNKTIVLPPYPTDTTLPNALEGLGLIGVSSSFHDNKCYSTRIWIDFDTSLGGDVDEIVIDTSNLVVDDDGSDSNTFQIVTRKNGGIKVDAPGGDFFRKLTNETPINVFVTGFLSSCPSEDCSFSYDSGLDPAVTSVVDAVVDGSVMLTISGSGFSSESSENIVTVGDLACEVTSASSSVLVCKLEAGAAGTYDVQVVVTTAGLATGSHTYTVSMEIFSNSPSAGSVGGGTTITVLGSGFPGSMDGWASGSVTIAGSTCTVTETAFDSFKCVTSPQTSGGRRKRAASEITVTVGASTTSGGSYEFDSSLTPTVTSLSTTSSTPMGGEELTIEGTAFGAAWGKVTIGENNCPIASWSSTKIVCTVPGNPHGNYPVHVTVVGNGYADVTAVSEMTYTFQVTGMAPSVGSIMGGTLMKIQGAGFGDCSNVEVNLGEMYTCEIGSCTDTEITCTTEKKSNVVQITNSGRHPSYGPGYVWSNTDVTVSPGDTIQWVWNLQVASDETKISVHQVASAGSDEYDGVGFKSMKGPNGRFQKKFTSTGVYYYSSEPVFGDSLFMKGVIRVVSSNDDIDSELSVKMAGIEAAQDITVSSGPVTISGCAISNDLTCAGSPTVTDTYIFRAAACLTPQITAVEVTGEVNANFSSITAYHGSTLTLTGTGFSSNDCQNTVMLGDSSCAVATSSETEITCVVDGSDSDLPSLVGQPIELSVLNLGNAVLDTGDSKYAELTLSPKIDSVNVVSGSWAGGNIFTLTGSGLLPDGGAETVFVTFGDQPYAMGCSIIDVSYTAINCMIPDFTDYKSDLASKSVNVTVQMGYDSFEPESMVQLEYEYSDDLTAVASSIDLSSVSANDLVTVSGENIGSSVQVYLTKAASRLRRRRSLKKREIPVAFEQAIEESFNFWTYMSNEPINWRCADGNCAHDSVIAGMNSEPSAKVKRSAEEDEQLSYLAEVNGMDLLNEICATDVLHCMKSLARDSPVHVVKRSTETELLEMALGSESYQAVVSASSATSVSFSVPEMPAGKYNVIVYVEGQGNALSSLGTIDSTMVINSVTPSSGSIYGGQTITLSGSGFCTVAGSTTVTVGGESCTVHDVTPGSITCTTPSGTAGSAVVSVLSCSVGATNTYTYDSSLTPAVTSISPTSASGAETITITGSNFGSSASVMLGYNECTVTASSDTSITCDVDALPGGDYEVTVNNPDLGNSNSDVLFTSTLNIASVTPSSGSFGGGSEMMITGTGFDEINTPTVTVCGNVCDIQSITTTQIDCLTPSNDASGSTEVCDVVVNQMSGSVTSSSAFTYDIALTPMVTEVMPKRGGTGGGTRLTITGSGFASSGNIVQIDGSICDIDTETTTEITCYTNYHSGAIEAPVIVEVPSQGYASYTNVDDAIFYYIDRWSSIWTWGGTGTPLEGEYIVITNGQTILLDTSTPVLKFLLIKGGTLMFDGEQSEINLQSEYILLVEGGQLIIGTEEEPYESKALITMHGNVRCTELPIFGCKVIGVRNGTLDFHGQYVPVTWTHLAETAPAGSTEIVLKQPVTWKAGDEIAIATTSDRSSMKENEERTIASVSADGYTLTLTEPLDYQHISITQTFGDREVETRGEVALLTRNIKVQGTMNEQFVEVLPACEEEFDSGAAFSDAMQTCFAGKFGEELGSDEMGAIIIISPKYKDQFLVAARIEYTEFTSVGQAFRVGRYPIHFHLPGNMSGSYVRGNAIHHSNNRACTLHDVSNLLVEHNVAYNIKGLSFFLEDGVEEYNTLQYNLAVFTRMSNSLLNPDINPASFWIVNPNNKFRHNSCAGGTHFCFWLRPAKIPDGPSYTRNYCPNKVPFDEFHNNTAHSMGWYGFWIFGQSNHATYDPHSGDVSRGYCNGDRIQTRIGSFTTWNNKRGFEIVSGANIRLENQTHMDHDFAGFEIFTAKGPYGEDGPGIFNTIIVGHSEISDLTEGKNESCIPGGIHLTDSGYTLKDISFYNFDRDCYAMQVRLEDPGATPSAIRVENLQFFNSPNKVFLESGEEQGMWFYDVDGSLTGTADSTLVGNTNSNPSSCVPDASGELGEANLGGQQGAVCPGTVKFHRMAMNGENSPYALQYNNLVLKNDFGNSSRPWAHHLQGWHGLLPEDTVNWLLFQSSEHVTNISYSIEVNGMRGDSDYVLIGHEFYQEPDRFTVLNSGAQTNKTGGLTELPTYESSESGDWYFTNETDSGLNELVYILSDKGPVSRKKRAGEGSVEGTQPSSGWHSGTFNVFRCFYENCLPPPPPTLPPGRPLNFHKWSNQSAWESFDSTMPVEGDTVIIPFGVWMVIDIDPPPLKRIYVYGGLEVGDEADHTLEVEILMVQGGKFECGTPFVPHVNKFDLVLKGNHFTEDQPLPNGPNLGAKALGVFGFLDMHGLETGIAFTKLAADVEAGATELELTEAVSWNVGSEIVISSTSYELHETERKTITAVSGTTITVDSPMEFKHISQTTTLDDGTEINMRGDVGLLSKNVRIVGNDYEDIADEQFGGRTLVGSFEQDDITYTGAARFSNVEFAVAGQEGWYDNYDPRFALAFLDIGDSEDTNGAPNTPESYVKNCTFNYNYNAAIGLFGANNIAVEGNVIYRIFDNGIIDESFGNRINRNLVTKAESISLLKGQTMNPAFHGCINIQRAKNVSLNDNIMAGCAMAGLKTLGSPCENAYQMSNNEVHSSLHGLHVNSYGITRPASGCVEFKSLFTWKNYDYGVYTKSDNSIVFSNIITIDNGVGLLPYIYGPSADSHLFEEKYMTFKDSHVVAVSTDYDCSGESKPDIFNSAMEGKRGWKGRNRWAGDTKFHHTGVVWPIFQSKYGKEKLAWYQPTVGAAGTNPALRGILNLSNVTFANFGANCDGEDVVFRTNFGEDDVNWPINSTDIKFVSVAQSNKVYLDVPNAGKINPADCTDFDCDGFKKAMIIDNDGSVFGDSLPGTIIPDSAYEWDGNPARGLGYYRVPKPMITELNGDRIAYEDKMPNTGIYRDSSCTYNDQWRAYKCSGISHRLMIIESMDRDTKIRRLSPVAVLANPGSNGYIDLVNGPQDFSCCSGYTCAERLSTMFTMVATGIEYEITFSSIPPQNFRIHLPYNEGGDAVRAKIWFPKQQRLDVYVDGRFVAPNNIDTTQEDYNLLPPSSTFIPDFAEMNGANYFDPNSGHLYVNVKGPSTIDVKTQPIVVLKMGVTVPIENFFEENVIGNIAGLLGIDPSNIRITNIVREGSVSRKRSTNETVTAIEFAIGPPPQDTLENFMPEEWTYTTPAGPVTVNPLYSTTTTTTTTTEWIPPANYLSFEDLQLVQANLANVFQTGGLAAALSMNVTGMSMENPIAPPQEPPEYTSPEERAVQLDKTWAEQSLANDTEALNSYEEVAYDIPEVLKVAYQPEDVKEMQVINPSVQVYVATAAGKMITALGVDSDPWTCTVSVLSGPGNVLGELTVPFVDGLATFDNLHVDAAGSNYTFEFSLSYPTTTSIAPISSLSFDVAGRPLGMKYTSDVGLIPENSTFTLTPDIWDEALDMIADASILSDKEWECTASLLPGENSGVLTGTTTITVSAGRRAVTFDDLVIDAPGLNYQVETTCFSSSYDNSTITTVSPPFHVHDFPVTGMLRQTGTMFTYKGPLKMVANVIEMFDNTMGVLTCKGKSCPDNTRAIEDVASKKTVRPVDKNINYPW